MLVATSFVNTMRSLDRRTPWGYGLGPVLALLGAWVGWMLIARVDVYTSSQRARIEVSGRASRVVAEEGGRVVELHTELGRRVTEGELLARLDSSTELATLALERAELATLAGKMSALRQQIEAERARRRSRAKVDELTGQRAIWGVEQAEVNASHERELAQITSELRKEQLTSRIEDLNAGRQLSSSRIAVIDAQTEVLRLHAEQQYQDKSELARLAELERSFADLEALEVVCRARVAAAQSEIERRTLRAPAQGSLGNIAPLQIGDVVKAGDVLATVVPNDDVRVVAELSPENAGGQVKAGQTARVRLDGFSWVEFGTIDAIVAHAAVEPHAGSIRVELVLEPNITSSIPLQHGLTGSVDILTSQASPWALLERSVGFALVRRPDKRLADPRIAQDSPR